MSCLILLYSISLFLSSHPFLQQLIRVQVQTVWKWSTRRARYPRNTANLWRVLYCHESDASRNFGPTSYFLYFPWGRLVVMSL